MTKQTAKQLPTAVFNAMIDGLTQLHLLRLPSAPPAKGLQAVASVWEAALLARAQWSDADALRLTTAFVQIAATADRWPLPKDVLAQLPPRPTPPALPSPPPVPCPDNIRKLLADLSSELVVESKL